MIRFIMRFLALAYLGLLFSCQPTEVELIRTDEVGKYSGSIVYILNNDLYMVGADLDGPRRLTNSPEDKKSSPVFHPSKEKIAYLDDQRSPVIIDTMGAVQERLDEHLYVRDMGWSADGQTLFMLINNEIQFYGPALPVPDFEFPFGTTSQSIYSIDISSRNELAYTYRFYSGLSYEYGVKVVSVDPNFEPLQDARQFYLFSFVRFSNDEEVVTYRIDTEGNWVFHIGGSGNPSGLLGSAFPHLYRSNGTNERLVHSGETFIASWNLQSDAYDHSITGLFNNEEPIELDYQ